MDEGTGRDRADRPAGGRCRAGRADRPGPATGRRCRSRSAAGRPADRRSRSLRRRPRRVPDHRQKGALGAARRPETAAKERDSLTARPAGRASSRRGSASVGSVRGRPGGCRGQVAGHGSRAGLRAPCRARRDGRPSLDHRFGDHAALLEADRREVAGRTGREEGCGAAVETVLDRPKDAASNGCEAGTAEHGRDRDVTALGLAGQPGRIRAAFSARPGRGGERPSRRSRGSHGRRATSRPEAVDSRS